MKKCILKKEFEGLSNLDKNSEYEILNEDNIAFLIKNDVDILG